MPLSIALTLILATPTGAPAMSAEAEMAMTSWTICQHQAQVVLAPSPGSAESVSESVMQRCDMDQRLFQAAWQKQNGARADADVRNLRENFRLAGVIKVLELRAGRTMVDPISIWSSCVGVHSIEKSPSEPAEVAADRALDSCVKQEDAVVEEAVRKLGRAYGPGVRQRFRSDAREGIVRMIMDCRANPAAAPDQCVQVDASAR